MGRHHRRAGRACMDGDQAANAANTASSGSRTRAPQSSALLSCRQLSGAPKHRPFRCTPIVRTTAVGVRQLLIHGLKSQRNRVPIFSQSAFRHHRGRLLEQGPSSTCSMSALPGTAPRIFFLRQERTFERAAPVLVDGRSRPTRKSSLSFSRSTARTFVCAAYTSRTVCLLANCLGESDTPLINIRQID